MLDFFINNPERVSYGRKEYPRWDWIRRNYKDTIDNLISYYNARHTVVNNKHILSIIVDKACPGYKMDLVPYFKQVAGSAKYLASHFKLVNNRSTGTVYTNIFYRSNSLEVICETEQDYEIEHVENNYLSYTPLRVVYTEETDLDFHLLNGLKDKPTPQFTVLELDITLMLLMYRAWARRRDKFNLGIDVNMFISTVVIPNAIRSIVDLIIFNRFIHISKGLRLSNFKLSHKIYVIDYSRGVDDTLTKVARDMINTSSPLLQFINTIPTIYYPDMFSALRLGRSVFTYQSLWSAWIARAKYIDVLLDLIGPKGCERNRSLTTLTHYDIKELKNNSTNYFGIVKSYKPIAEEYTKIIDTIDRKADY